MESITQEQPTFKNPRNSFSKDNLPSRGELEESPIAPLSTVHEDMPSSGRKLLLAASFRLFLRRLHHGFPVTRSELVYLLPYADDTDHTAGVAA
jgi:hypothetical protein